MAISTREQWIEAAGGLKQAVEYESRTLNIGREFLPACALAVLDGGEGSPEYWAWLADSFTETTSEE